MAHPDLLSLGGLWAPRRRRPGLERRLDQSRGAQVSLPSTGACATPERAVSIALGGALSFRIAQ